MQAHEYCDSARLIHDRLDQLPQTSYSPEGLGISIQQRAPDRRDAVIRFHQEHATLWVGRLREGDTVTLPDAPYVHAFMARGDGRIGDSAMAAGDAARLTEAGALTLTATGDAEVVVWEMHAALQ